MAQPQTNTSAPATGAEILVHDKAAEMAAFDALPAELRALLNFGPGNQSAIPVLELAIRHGPRQAATLFRLAIGRFYPGWTPDSTAPDVGL
jgi:hypothetical protein